MKTGVLVHGCNLNIENWRYVAWGDPPSAMGRIPQGLLTAWEMEADVIVFGTGASQKEFRLGNSPRSGETLLEAEYSMEYLRMHFDNLQRFAQWRPFVARKQAAGEDIGPEQWETLKADCLGRIVLDLQSQNTVEEIEHAATLFAQQGIDRIVLVSSPTHIVRCLRDATSLFAERTEFQRFSNHLLAVPSNTCYEGTSPSDVVVIEPPHRPDRHVVPTHRRIQRMLALQKLNQNDLVKLIEEFDDLLQRYEHRFFSE